jgi:hypothetical protein
MKKTRGRIKVVRSTIRWCIVVLFSVVFGVTLFAEEINVNNSLQTNSNFVSGSIEKADLFNALVDKELSIVIATISMIEDKGIVPTTIVQLKTGNYLPSSFNEENLISNPSKNISFSVVGNVIEINTNINENEITIPERDYYLNNTYNNNNNFNIVKKQILNSSNTLQSNYYINRKSVNILGTKSTNSINHTSRYIGNQEPSVYSTVSNGNIWFDSNVKEFDVKQRINNKWSDTTTSNKNLNEDGTFISPKTLQITAVIKNFENVTVTEETKVIICRTSGATYNQTTNRCEAFTSDACDGNYFDTTTGKCYIKPIDYCISMGYDGYDSVRDRCSRTNYTNKVSTTKTVNVRNYYWYHRVNRHIEYRTDYLYGWTSNLSTYISGFNSGYAQVSGNTGILRTRCNINDQIWYMCTYYYNMPSVAIEYKGGSTPYGGYHLFSNGGTEGDS